MYPSSPLAERLLESHKRTLLYEVPSSHAAALRLIPVQVTADCSEGPGDPGKTADQRDRLLYRLLVWFKDEFFTWFEPESCGSCGVQLVLKGHRTVSPVSPTELAYRAEVYGCSRCGGPPRAEFSRYNHPRKLLETRTGRCGEWANCFTLCCRAVGLEARFVEDSQDHVWTEVYSESERRWLHVDPCERTLDRPNVYESGWGKKFEYVFGYSAHEVSDVTYRYSCDHAATTRRRRSYTEDHLARTLVQVNTWLQRDLPESRRRQLAERRVAELLQLLCPPAVGGEPAPGRQSGSLAWRLARGETSRAAAAGGFVFLPTPQEREQLRLEWSYSIVEDRYTRGSSSAAGWASCVHAAVNLQRKLERDWRQVYLCRRQGAASGTVSWYCQLEDGLSVSSVTVVCRAAVFESGRARWSVSGDSGESLPLKADGRPELVTALAGSTVVTLSAALDGGNGENAFQHAQLLRTSLDGPEVPLRITMLLQRS